MSILKKLLGRDSGESKARVRVCIECGMPVEAHKDWCAIFQTQQDMERKRQTAIPAGAQSPGLSD
jgi:hypothetical protein